MAGATCSPPSRDSLRHQQSPSEALLPLGVLSAIPLYPCLSTGPHASPPKQRFLCLAHLIRALGLDALTIPAGGDTVTALESG